MKFTLKPQSALKSLFIFVALLLIGQCIAIILRVQYAGLDQKASRLIIKLFDFNLEANLPTYFSSLVLLFNGILLFLIGARYKNLKKPFWHWLGLSFVFTFLALDEMIQIHEQLRAPVEALLNTSGVFYFAWFIPYGIFTILLGLAYLKFLNRLPKQILKLFIVSGVLFLSGAIGLEALSGMYAETHGEETLLYYLMYTIEELLEMSGSIVFFYALLVYITTHFEMFQIKLILENE